MNRFLFLLSFFLIQCQTPGQAQTAITDSGGPLIYEQAALDMTFYDLALEIRPETQSIEGALTAHAEMVHPVSWFVLDLDTLLTVDSVEILSDTAAVGEVRFERRGGKLWIDLWRTYQPGDRAAVRVRYHGKPRVADNPPWGGGFTWAETEAGEPWIATSLQGEGADLWWPTKDHPSDEPDSMAMHFEVPADLVVASNGVLRGVTENPGGTKTYHWFSPTPINNYAVALNAAPYRTIEGAYTSITGEEIPVTFWVLPERYEEGKELFPQFLEHLAFYEKYLGPYPFRTQKYGVAHTPFLGMEHQTIIAYGAGFSNEDYGYDWLHHHELAHEWWGNLVTAYDWRDFWIHEGLATYMQALYSEELFGEEAYREAIAQYRAYLRNVKPVAPRPPTTSDDIYFIARNGGEPNNDIYYKGAAVLHTLRYLIGDEDFFTLLHSFAYPTEQLEQATDGSQCRFATTEDFIDMAEAISGMELGWFFEVYLRRSALPELVRERTFDGVTFHWSTPDGLSFPMPVDVEADGHVQRLDFSNGGAVAVPASGPVAVDPEEWVLRQTDDE